MDRDVEDDIFVRAVVTRARRPFRTSFAEDSLLPWTDHTVVTPDASNCQEKIDRKWQRFPAKALYGEWGATWHLAYHDWTKIRPKDTRNRLQLESHFYALFEGTDCC